ncbi:hypothetical protein BGC_23160 [Burkholderia sp. 3C]
MVGRAQITMEEINDKIIVIANTSNCLEKTRLCIDGSEKAGAMLSTKFTAVSERPSLLEGLRSILNAFTFKVNSKNAKPATAKKFAPKINARHLRMGELMLSKSE